MPLQMMANDSYALFRAPGASHFTTIRQHTLPAAYQHITDVPLTGGYVVVPFTPTPETPIVLIRPEEVKEQEIPLIHHAPTSGSHAIPQVNDTNERKAYTTAFQEARILLKNGSLEKIVLSRRLHCPIPQHLSSETLFLKACHSRPNCYVALWHTPQTGSWLVATPEPLLNQTNQSWHTVALAGTLPWKEKGHPLWNHKNREEQAIVARYIEKRLEGRCLHLQKSSTYSRRAGNIQHLCTDFSFQLQHDEEALSLLQQLHPTPAVCGMPRPDAREAILRIESSPRKYYAGFSGPIFLQGCTSLYVSLRCMQFSEQKATLYAGGGIMNESEENDEWEETNRKLQTMLNLL